ncbi:39S ribosomal protein L38, mitochondrial [Apophysomyces ossiformis]|uniref:39S ribosomal protein L38, mitochondrial n=1 Tax=Apophysomyces ossiformis TaxID=679940 RepID=A0A8H7BVX3_9FUNG|nr:39S ribosomal protein L38, mitochondrial [Apophysomyces ossiformis]
MRFNICFTTAIIASVFGVSALTAPQAKKIKDGLIEGHIIPDGNDRETNEHGHPEIEGLSLYILVLDDFEPTTYMKITYHDDRLLEMGDEVLPEEVVEAPHIWFKPPTPGAEYTLVMIDADTQVPHVRHWISTNIDGGKPGSSLRDTTPLHQYTPYHGPTPPAGSGKHRYVFILLEQTEKNQAMRPALQDPNLHRAFFSVKDFIRDNNLRPVAAQYMVASHQDGYEGEYMTRHRSGSASASAISSSIAAPVSSTA